MRGLTDFVFIVFLKTAYVMEIASLKRIGPLCLKAFAS